MFTSSRARMFSLISRVQGTPFTPLQAFMPAMPSACYRSSLRMLPTRVEKHDNEIWIEMLVPKFKESDVTLAVKQGRLTVSGHREAGKERSLFDTMDLPLTFQQTMELPDDLNLDKMTKSVSDGVLRVRIPFQESFDDHHPQEASNDKGTSEQDWLGNQGQQLSQQQQQQQQQQLKSKGRPDEVSTAESPNAVAQQPKPSSPLAEPLSDSTFFNWPPQIKRKVQDGRAIYSMKLPVQIKKDNLSLDVREGCVYISVRQRVSKKEEGFEMSSSSEYTTTIEVPYNTKPSDIKAKFDHHTLSLSVPEEKGNRSNRNVPIS